MTGPLPERPEGLGDPPDDAAPAQPEPPPAGAPEPAAGPAPPPVPIADLDPTPDDPRELPPEPRRRLAPGVLGMWVAGGLVSTLIAVFLASIVLPVLERLDGVPAWLGPAAIALLAVYALVAIAVAPVIRYRTWRYAVRSEELDLTRGWLVRTRTIIPMARVQHVDTAQTALGRMLDIASLKVHTAAATHEIPGLAVADAYRLRTEIARRARVADEV